MIEDSFQRDREEFRIRMLEMAEDCASKAHEFSSWFRKGAAFGLLMSVLVSGGLSIAIYSLDIGHVLICLLVQGMLFRTVFYSINSANASFSKFILIRQEILDDMKKTLEATE